MAESTTVKVPRDGTLVLKDNGGSNTYTVAFENGDVSFGRDKAERIVIRDRGVIVGSRKGDDPVITVTFTVHMRMFTTSAGSDLTLVDFIDGTGNAAGFTKVGAEHEEYNIDIQFTVEDGTTDQVVTFSKCICTWEFSEGSPDSISVTAECMGGYTATGPT
tara:strand:+ start:86 stop:568 length:483 start_codon:yes stop_codon:yes gene_type:complete